MEHIWFIDNHLKKKEAKPDDAFQTKFTERDLHILILYKPVWILLSFLKPNKAILYVETN